MTNSLPTRHHARHVQFVMALSLMFLGRNDRVTSIESELCRKARLLNNPVWAKRLTVSLVMNAQTPPSLNVNVTPPVNAVLELFVKSPKHWNQRPAGPLTTPKPDPLCGDWFVFPARSRLPDSCSQCTGSALFIAVYNSQHSSGSYISVFGCSNGCVRRPIWRSGYN